MSDLRPKGTMITLGDKEYGMLFNLNAIDDIQDHFDISISALGDLMKDERKAFKALKYIVALLINEWIGDNGNAVEPVTEQFVGRKISVANMGELKTSVFAAFTAGTPKGDDDEGESEEESPNAASE